MIKLQDRPWWILCHLHYNDVIMSTMASQITSLTFVYSTVYSGADQRKHRSSAVTGLCEVNSPVTSDFPAQRASNAEKSFHFMTSSWLDAYSNIHPLACWWRPGNGVCCKLKQQPYSNGHYLLSSECFRDQFEHAKGNRYPVWWVAKRAQLWIFKWQFTIPQQGYSVEDNCIDRYSLLLCDGYVTVLCSSGCRDRNNHLFILT